MEGDDFSIPAQRRGDALPGSNPLTGRARVLVDALRRKSSKSERSIGMYLEALRAIARDDGPESLHVAGYELREFMNALPQALDLPVLKYQQLRSKVQTFVATWRDKLGKTECRQGSVWGGIIDDALRELLSITGNFVDWVEKEIPKRRTEVTLVLGKLAPTDNPLPSALLTMRTDDWSTLLKYFNDCTHHDSDIDPVEFKQSVDRLEIFLLEHLEPRTFEDQAEIDTLIASAENDEGR